MKLTIELCKDLKCDKGKTLKDDTVEVIDCPYCKGEGFVVRVKQD